MITGSSRQILAGFSWVTCGLSNGRIDERRRNAGIAGCLGELVKRTVVSALVGGVRRSIQRPGSLGESAKRKCNRYWRQKTYAAVLGMGV